MSSANTLWLSATLAILAIVWSGYGFIRNVLDGWILPPWPGCWTVMNMQIADARSAACFNAVQLALIALSSLWLLSRRKKSESDFEKIIRIAPLWLIPLWLVAPLPLAILIKTTLSPFGVMSTPTYTQQFARDDFELSRMLKPHFDAGSSVFSTFGR